MSVAFNEKLLMLKINIYILCINFYNSCIYSYINRQHKLGGNKKLLLIILYKVFFFFLNFLMPLVRVKISKTPFIIEYYNQQERFLATHIKDYKKIIYAIHNKKKIERPTCLIAICACFSVVKFTYA